MNSEGAGMGPSMIELTDDDSTTTADDANADVNELNTTPTTSGSKRQKDISPCFVCGAKAHGYNFDQITCESCKAFFRRNALKSMDKFRCRNSDKCVITPTTRKRCKRCRLSKCFNVGMRKEWILTEEEKFLKRRKIERNRLIKQKAQTDIHPKFPQDNELMHTKIQTNASSSTAATTEQPSPTHSQGSTSKRSTEPSTLALPLMHMYRSPDQKLLDRQQCLLKQMSDGYLWITQQYPQPNKFVHRNQLIAQTIDMDSKLMLVKDLTRELTQMTTSRLLHYFTLIPEFQLFTETEKKYILIKNMLAVFMFHGALTYNAENDTFVDRTTADQPYDAKYLLFVYGPTVYTNFIALARGLTSVAYQSSPDKGSDERSHILFLLLMVILLFSDGFDPAFEITPHDPQQAIETASKKNSMNRSLSTTSESTSSSSSVSSTSPSLSSKLNEKLHKIQQTYIELACRHLHETFGLSTGRRLFQNLLPLLFDLQKLCSTLANVNLCELAEGEDRASSSRAMLPATSAPSTDVDHPPSHSPSAQFNATMISGTSHLNELQKENRAPPPSTSLLLPASSTARSALSNSSTSSSSSPSVLSDSIATFDNYHA